MKETGNRCFRTGIRALGADMLFESRQPGGKREQATEM